MKKVDENGSEWDTKLPRRHFVSAALLAGAGLLPSTAAAAPAEKKEICSELLSLPRPADALVDLYDFLSGIENGILSPYYGIVSNISGEISTRYSDLKKAAEEFRRLVPGLKADAGISRFQNLTDIGIISAASMGKAPATVNAVYIGDHSNVMKITSKDLGQSVRQWDSDRDTLTLSAAAVEKLRQMLRMIARLEEPTTDLDAAAAALSKASAEVRAQVGEIRPLVRDATRLLVAADIIENPPLNAIPNFDAVSNLLKKLGKNNEPTTIPGLRTLAVRKIHEASAKLGDLSRYVVPRELSKYLDKAVAQKQQMTNNMPIDVIQTLLLGTVGWIERGDSKPQTVAGSADGDVEFVRAGMRYSAGWFGDLWGQIRGILAEQMPQATNGRIWQLYLRKVAVSFKSTADQERVFYNLLPYLAQPSDIDMWTNTDVRRQAAVRLARI